VATCLTLGQILVMLPSIVVSCLSDSKLGRVALFSASHDQCLHCIDNVCYIMLMLSSCNNGSSASARTGSCLSRLHVICSSPDLDIIDRRFAPPVMSCIVYFQWWCHLCLCQTWGMHAWTPWSKSLHGASVASGHLASP